MDTAHRLRAALAEVPAAQPLLGEPERHDLGVAGADPGRQHDVDPGRDELARGVELEGIVQNLIAGPHVAIQDEVNAVDIKYKRKIARYDEETKSEGTYVLRTNRNELSDEQIWQIYIMLGHIEKAFKDMKSHLGFRPNFHQKGDRVEAHMFISVLAYHLMNAIEHKLRLAGDRRSWWTIKNVPRTHERVTIEYTSKDAEGSRYRNKLRINTRVEPEHVEIYTKLGLSGKPLKRLLLSRKIGSDNKPGQIPLRE